MISCNIFLKHRFIQICTQSFLSFIIFVYRFIAKLIFLDCEISYLFLESFMWIKWHGYNNARWNWWRLKAHPCIQGRIMQAIKKHPSERMEFLFAYYLTAISKFFCLWFFHWKYHFYVTYIFNIAVTLDLPLFHSW